ncbi:kinase-like domain-containing protein [Mycena capillaripes]|nr:kinase-like domain-containing protein [Mycena capillaripes]
MSYSHSGAGASPYLPDLTGTFVDDGFFKLVQLLGSGRSAKVYKALDTTSPDEDPIYYAVKCMRNDAPGSKRVAALRNEFDLHKSVSGRPGIVKFHGIFTDGKKGEYVFMVLDMGCSMQDAIVKRQLYVDRPALIRDALFQVLDAVEECHRDGVYHRDLQPVNLICDLKGSWIRIADFGAATRDEESTEFQCGTPGYTSPECADSTRVSYSPRESDLWAVGVILFSLITGTTPWENAHPSDAKYAAYRADEDNYLIEVFHLTRAANDFFRWCFASKPADRPTLDEMYYAVRDIGRFCVAHASTLHTTRIRTGTAPRPVNVAGSNLRFVDRQMQSITTRQRFAAKLRRIY